MQTVEVTAPDGRRWRVNRGLKWPRWREPNTGDANLGDLAFWIGPDDFALVGLVIGLILFLVFGLLIVFLLPLVLFVLEALLVVGALLIMRSMWIVDATTIGPPPEARAWRVRGWRRSKRALDEVVRELRLGVEAASEEGELELR